MTDQEMAGKILGKGFSWMDRALAAEAQSTRLLEAIKVAREAIRGFSNKAFAAQHYINQGTMRSALVKIHDEAKAAFATLDAAMADVGEEGAHEGHPCSLCDSSGRCTFSCEGAESIAPPTAEQVSANRYWSMLILAAKVLDDLSLPDPALRKPTQYQEACGRLRDEIRSVALADVGEG